jgi:hypothetical protein
MWFDVKKMKETREQIHLEQKEYREYQNFRRNIGDLQIGDMDLIVGQEGQSYDINIEYDDTIPGKEMDYAAIERKYNECDAPLPQKHLDKCKKSPAARVCKRAKLPFYLVGFSTPSSFPTTFKGHYGLVGRYGSFNFRVYPICELAKSHLKVDDHLQMNELEYVFFLYEIRGKQPPSSIIKAHENKWHPVC